MPAKKRKLLIGAHMSISGGVDHAPLRGHEVGCACIQIFTKSNMQWAARPLAEKEIVAFHANCQSTGIWPVMAHDSYLINLCAPDQALAKKSLDSFRMELERCGQLDLPALIMHPGSAMGRSEQEGLRAIAEALNECLAATKGSKVKVLLETTAGQGSNLGHRFEHLAEMIAAIEDQSRVGVCFDTCHVFAAGYNISTPAGYEGVMEQFDRIIGLEWLQAFHFNDAKGEFGSHLDRHEHIGRGKLGEVAFRLILRDPRFADIPKFLETPKEEKGKKGQGNMDVVNLGVLRRLAGER